MTKAQKTVKYLALAFAALLILGMVSSIFSIAAFLFGGGGVTEELFSVEVNGEYDALQLELTATALEIRSGSAWGIETNNCRLSFETDGDVLSVEEEKPGLFGEKEDAFLVLTVPAEIVLRSVELTAGAGSVSIEALYAERIDFEFGAGEVKIGALTAEISAEIDGGAGKIGIEDGSLRDLDLDMGVGELDLCAELLGNASIDCGIGEVKLTLLGSMEDYTVRASKGIGEVTLNGAVLANGGSVGNGSAGVAVSGGIGAIRIFTASESD